MRPPRRTMAESEVIGTKSRLREAAMAIVTPFGSLASLEAELAALSGDIRSLRIIGRPHIADMRTAPVLECWTLGGLALPCLTGAVVGHPLLGDSPRIHTSQLIAMDPDVGWARTWSRFYRLAEPSGIPSRN